MTGPAASRAPVYVVGLAARLLSSPHRDRYRREFTAELFEVPREDQLRYALRVLSRTWALRAALTTHAPATIAETTMTKPLRCILRLHTWRTRHNEEGQPYQACTRCTAERESLSLNDYGGFSGGGPQGV